MDRKSSKENDVGDIDFEGGLKARADSRECGECTHCNRETLCGWKSGFLLDEHSPELLGLVMEAKEIDGLAAFSFREVKEGARLAEKASKILSAFSRVAVVLVADLKGEITNAMGPEEQMAQIDFGEQVESRESGGSDLL
jgi:hypothetical protein